jgi:hypothetical protein
MTSRAAAAAASQVEASLSSLSSELLTRVANWLSVNELCFFDTALTNKQLRAKYLSGMSSDTHLYPGPADRYHPPYNSAWQQKYVQWFTMRRVFVNSIFLNEHTTASILMFYDTMNRVKPGLISLTIHRGADFPMDIAVRNVKTLRKLELRNYGSEQLRKVMESVREWESMGGSLEELVLRGCDFSNMSANFGSCDPLLLLVISDCSSTLIEVPGESLGCSCLLWGILPKCKNLKRFEVTHHGIMSGSKYALYDQDLCLLARFCPDLEHLNINTLADEVQTTALLYVVCKCTKLQHLILNLWDPIVDCVLLAIATNLLSLRTLTISELKLQNLQTLRCLAHGCPQLRELSIEIGDMHEAELLYLVEHAKNLHSLAILQLEQFDSWDSWGQSQIDDYLPHELQRLGVDDTAAFKSEQRARLDSLRAAAQPPGEMGIVQRLQAASSNPHFRVLDL